MTRARAVFATKLEKLCKLYNDAWDWIEQKCPWWAAPFMMGLIMIPHGIMLLAFIAIFLFYVFVPILVFGAALWLSYEFLISVGVL